MNDITFDCELTKKDYQKSARFSAYFRNPITLLLMIAIFLVGLLTLITPLLPDMHLAFSIIFLLYPLFLIGTTESRIRKMSAERVKDGNIRQTITINGDGIAVVRSDNEFSHSWNEVKKLYETKEQLIVCTTANKLLTLPKRNLSNTELRAIRGIVVNSLSYKKYRIQK